MVTFIFLMLTVVGMVLGYFWGGFSVMGFAGGCVLVIMWLEYTSRSVNRVRWYRIPSWTGFSTISILSALFFWNRYVKPERVAFKIYMNSGMYQRTAEPYYDKLGGIAFNTVHKDSVRVGFRSLEAFPDEFEICEYIYRNGVREIGQTAVVSVNDVISIYFLERRVMTLHGQKTYISYSVENNDTELFYGNFEIRANRWLVLLPYSRKAMNIKLSCYAKERT